MTAWQGNHIQLLLLSIAVLWLAPWLHRLILRNARVAGWTQKALIVLVVALVLGSILPDAVRLIGWSALAVVAAGTLLPSALERAWRQLARTVHWFPLAVGLLGLALHASLDGAAFVDPEHPGHVHVPALPMAVVVHRFFEGLFVWLFLGPRFGTRVAAGALAMITVFSLVGYWAGDHFFHSVEEAAPFGLFQALVAGSLLHLVIDQHDHGTDHAQD